jgi:D-glycero-D-manno-heptose 1,7-bisphosphate phosphatase
MIAVASNQSGVGRGLLDLDTLSAIHDALIEAVEDAGGHIDLIVFCPHAPQDDCECRKPKAGLLRRIEAEFGTTLAGQWSIGDSARDLAAARAVGARPVLVRTGNGRKTEAELADDDVIIFDDLAAAVDALLETQ